MHYIGEIVEFLVRVLRKNKSSLFSFLMLPSVVVLYDYTIALNISHMENERTKLSFR